MLYMRMGLEFNTTTEKWKDMNHVNYPRPCTCCLEDGGSQALSGHRASEGCPRLRPTPARWQLGGSGGRLIQVLMSNLADENDPQEPTSPNGGWLKVEKIVHVNFMSKT